MPTFKLFKANLKDSPLFAAFTGFGIVGGIIALSFWFVHKSEPVYAPEFKKQPAILIHTKEAIYPSLHRTISVYTYTIKLEDTDPVVIELRCCVQPPYTGEVDLVLQRLEGTDNWAPVSLLRRDRINDA